ncbi:hypothetical protein H4R35_007394 [Dimargaris xerosporica]|nr:hypothetical protein H4R35_007394 [Dimargaris xerosporica]
MSSRPTRHTESRHMRHGPSEYDKLRQAIPQPAQVWVKQWTTPSSGTHSKSARGTYRAYRWTRASKPTSIVTHLAYSSDEETSTMAVDNTAQPRGDQDLDLRLGDIPIPVPAAAASHGPSQDHPPPASADPQAVSPASESATLAPLALATQVPGTAVTSTLDSPAVGVNSDAAATSSPRLIPEPSAAMETE